MEPIRTPGPSSQSSGPSTSSNLWFAQQPDQAGYHSELGLSWNYLGYLYDEARNNTEALAAFEQAVAEQQLAVDKANEVDDYRGYLANHLDNLGEQFVDLGRVAMGLPSYRRALRIHRELSAAHPQNRDLALDVLRSMIRLGTTERHDGDFGRRPAVVYRRANAPGPPVGGRTRRRRTANSGWCGARPRGEHAV